MEEINNLRTMPIVSVYSVFEDFYALFFKELDMYFSTIVSVYSVFEDFYALFFKELDMYFSTKDGMSLKKNMYTHPMLIVNLLH